VIVANDVNFLFAVFNYDMEDLISRWKGLLDWLLQLGIEPRCVHWCSLVGWCNTYRCFFTRIILFVYISDICI